MPRPYWKGYLKLSLVTCPVAMMPATSEGEKIRFHTLNRKTGNRIRSQYVDSVTGAPVEDGDEVKGYPRGENDYIILEEEELHAVGLESVRTIDIDMFVPAETIEWIWYDKPHYLMPDDKVGEDAFAVIRDAMAETGMVGIARLVLNRRERAIMLAPRGKGIVLWTLRYGDEVRDAGSYFGKIGAPDIDPEERELVGTLIDQRVKPWDAQMVHDPVQERLLEIIASKKKGRPTKRPASEAPPPPPPNVVNIMDALRKSIASEHRPARGASVATRKGSRKGSAAPSRKPSERPGKRGN